MAVHQALISIGTKGQSQYEISCWQQYKIVQKNNPVIWQIFLRSIFMLTILNHKYKHPNKKFIERLIPRLFF